MAFVAAMSSPPLTKEGVKGSDVYTEEGVGDLRVSFFTQLVRGLSSCTIQNEVGKIFAKGDATMTRDLLVMAFQTRDVRGGKGERDLFYHMIGAICTQHMEWSKDILELVPEYGCWRDMWSLYTLYPFLRSAIDSIVKAQFILDQETEHPSLLVKWLPREGSKYDGLARHFAALLFPLTSAEKGQRMRVYRRALATLNRAVDTTEIKMCGRTWSAIQPRKVPGRLMKRCKHAFLNETIALPRRPPAVRYPGLKDREECAEHFREYMRDVASGREKMKGATTTMPHEHVHEILTRGVLSSDVESVIQAQWNAIRDEVLSCGGLGNVVAMCDFSGSMNGLPKEVSLSLGILISEVTSPAFRDHILTFDESPRWHSFSACKTLSEKVYSVGSLGQGLNTNFQAACDLILKRLIEHKVPPTDAPKDLLVLTDMGFDAACENQGYNSKGKLWETHFQMIRCNFEQAGYVPPRIVCWNLRAEYKDYHATAFEEGIVQLSGWSPAVLKTLQTNGVEVKTPYEGLRALLDDVRYDPVRRLADRLGLC